MDSSKTAWHWHHEVSKGEFDGFMMLLFICIGCWGILALVRSLSYLKKDRLLSDLQTSKIRSIALGTVQLKGIIDTWNTVSAPLSGIPCIYFRYLIQAKNSEGGWSSIKNHFSKIQHFFLSDDTGKVLVNPEGARIEATLGSRWISGIFRPLPPHVVALLRDIEVQYKFLGLPRTLRFSEWRFAIGAEIFLVGECKDNRMQALKNSESLSPVEERIAKEKIIIGNCEDGEHTFLISRRKEEAIIQEMRDKREVQFYLAAILIPLSLFGLLFYKSFGVIALEILKYYLTFLSYLYQILY